jgi:hypothetical protein
MHRISVIFWHCMIFQQSFPRKMSRLISPSTPCQETALLGYGPGYPVATSNVNRYRYFQCHNSACAKNMLCNQPDQRVAGRNQNNFRQVTNPTDDLFFRFDCASWQSSPGPHQSPGTDGISHESLCTFGMTATE